MIASMTQMLSTLSIVLQCKSIKLQLVGRRMPAVGWCEGGAGPSVNSCRYLGRYFSMH